MALIAAQPAAASLGDPLVDIPSVDDDLDELFRPMQASIDAESAEQASRTNASKRSRVEDDLGLDDEIQIIKKRKPVAKLDDDRLLSQAGIPKLRRIVRERLKFKGKGHEFSDVARMLNLYQLWLDDLYPRAKFSDGLAMIEKLGHSKRMNVMRKEWIKETNTSTSSTSELDSNGGRVDGDNGKNADTNTDQQLRTNEVREAEEESLFVGGDKDAQNANDGDEQPDDDDLDALLAAEMPALPVKHVETEKEANLPEPEPEQAEMAFEDQYAEEMAMMAGMEEW